jgi:hypothetical protein
MFKTGAFILFLHYTLSNVGMETLEIPDLSYVCGHEVQSNGGLTGHSAIADDDEPGVILADLGARIGWFA